MSQDIANLQASIHEAAYQAARSIGVLRLVEFLGQTLKPWVAWRIERDAL